jgi:hypothetical protein
MIWGIRTCYDDRMVWRRFAEMRPVGMLLLLVFAAIVAVCLETVTPTRNAPVHQPAVVPQFAIEDFDGDSRPDIATVQEGRNGAVGNHYWISFQLSTGGTQSIDLAAPAGGLDISSRDVNRDAFVDVVVTATGTNHPVAVLLNNGEGTFTASDPSAFPDAFRKSNNLWSRLTEKLRGTAPALLQRFYSSDLEATRGPFSVPVEIAVHGSPGLGCMKCLEISVGLYFFPTYIVPPIGTSAEACILA